jgi:hypothetical protein
MGEESCFPAHCRLLSQNSYFQKKNWKNLLATQNQVCESRVRAGPGRAQVRSKMNKAATEGECALGRVTRGCRNVTTVMESFEPSAKIDFGQFPDVADLIPCWREFDP